MNATKPVDAFCITTDIPTLQLNSLHRFTANAS